MAKPLSILFVTSEASPFAKVGGLADVSYSLPLAIREIGHDIRVMLPKYGTVSERKNRIHEINRLKDMPIPIGKGADMATVKSSSINNPRNKVQAYITTNQKYFDAKKGIYGNIKTGEDYSDNDERFIFFSRSVIETCLLLGWFPDIIHCNGWQTSLIAAFAKVMFPDKFKKTKIILTIHNLVEQGEFPVKTFDKTGLPKAAAADFKHKNKFNFLKGGIVHADYITTVSPEYANEILNDATFTNGLNELILKKSKTFKGILNGIDPWAWDPKSDDYLNNKLNSDINSFKMSNKKTLAEKFGLEYDPEKPILGMIARLGAEKGYSLILDSLDELFKNDLQLVVLTYGDSEFKKDLKKAAKKHSGKMSLQFGFDEEIAHLIEAGSDIYLAPSLYEPCGLNAMYSIKYGSPPIARATGGLKDIIQEFNAKTEEGNGFLFEKYDKKDFLKAVKKAIDVFNKKELWDKLVQNGLKADFSWENNIEEYDEIYRQVTS